MVLYLYLGIADIKKDPSTLDVYGKLELMKGGGGRSYGVRMLCAK